MNSRTLKKFKLPKEAFRQAYWYCLNYRLWRDELDEIAIIASPNNDGLPRGSETGDPTSAKAMRAAELTSKMQIVENAAHEAGDDMGLYVALMKAATTQNVSYNWLRNNGYLYSGERQYRERRRYFYYLVHQSIG